MVAKVKRILIPNGKRVICISDIHGNLSLFKRLLDKVNYSNEDVLILLGDIYTKGKQKHETLQSIIKMSKNPNVYTIRGNCDFEYEYLDDTEKKWLDNLPHIIESDNYIFVHGGISSDNLDEQNDMMCMKNDAFMEKDVMFKKYVITGHWPTVNYTHGIPCFNPVINKEKHIIAIDGGNVIKRAGQLNAFIIHNDEFTFDFVDEFSVVQIKKGQISRGGELNITWTDRFVECVENCGEFSFYKHLLTGKVISLPTHSVWDDGNGNLSGCSIGTDYYFPINAGDCVSLVAQYSNKILAKKNGILGWIDISNK